MPEGGVDDGVRRLRSAAQTLQVFESAAMRFGAGDPNLAATLQNWLDLAQRQISKRAKSQTA